MDSASFMNAHTGGGTSVADAVIINEKKSETKVITEKNNWLRFKYPGYTYIKSIIIQNTSTKSISMTEIKKADGEIIDVYFDDTAFYSPYVKTPAK
ncbi:MAG: hypothetical protein HY064_14145 [Bacteroidetes bacterium]|nr:hypothetical protein [Bacteroidota bacterium]